LWAGWSLLRLVRMAILSTLILLECAHLGIRGVALAQSAYNSNNQGDAPTGSAKQSDIINYDEVKPILSVHRGRLIRINGRLTSLVIARNSVTYGITARDGSLIFVRGSLPPKYTHTGIAVTVVARVPENASSVLTLELVDFEQAQSAWSPSVSRAYQEGANVIYQAPIERALTAPPAQIAQSTHAASQQPYSVQSHIPVFSGQPNAVQIYSAWTTPAQPLQGIATPLGALSLHASAASPQASSTQIQPVYATPPIQPRGNMPSRGVNYIGWRSEYGAHAAQQGERVHQLTQPALEGTYTDARLRPNLIWQGFPSSDVIRTQVQHLLPSYKRAALYFNPSLSDEQATRIARALLYYSILYGVDPRFVVAVIAVESSFRPDAVGQKGEMGLGQLMPSTAASLGVSNPFDPEQNIEGCVRLLSRYLTSYAHLPPERQIALALACYNAGPNAVSKYGGVPPYPITQRYIKKVTELYKQLCGIQ